MSDYEIACIVEGLLKLGVVLAFWFMSDCDVRHACRDTRIDE